MVRDRDRDRERDSGASRVERSQAYRSYKTALNQLFEGKRELAPELKSKLQADAVAVTAKSRRQAVDTLISASHPKDVLAAYHVYHAQYGFPDHEEALSKLLDVSDPAVIVQAIQTIGKLREGGTLKRGASLKARIKTVQMTCDDPDVQTAAQAVLSVL